MGGCFHFVEKNLKCLSKAKPAVDSRDDKISSSFSILVFLLLTNLKDPRLGLYSIGGR